MVILLTSFTVLLLTSAAYGVYEFLASRRELEREAQVTAEIVAAKAGIYLVFHEPDEATTMLGILSAATNVLSAALYDTNGVIFARYTNHNEEPHLPSKLPALGKQYAPDALQWTEPVIHNGKPIGTLLVRSSLEPLRARVQLYLPIGGVVLLGSFLVALFLSNYLQKAISHPILELAKTARIVSEGHNYQVRAPKVAGHELGILVDAFNHMLEKIQEHEATLEQSAARLRLALEASQTAAWDWDIARNEFNWDDLMFRQFGIARAKTLPTFETFLEAIHPADRTEVDREIRASMKEVRDFKIEFRIVLPQGQIHHLAVRGNGIYSSSGQPVRMTGVSIDITDRKKAEEAHAFLAAIVESSDDAIIGEDLDGTIASWNAGAQRMFGYSAPEMMGRSASQLADLSQRDEESRILERIGEGSLVEHYETQRLRKDGTLVEVSLSVSPIRNPQGVIVGASSIARDVTSRKQAEQALAQQAAALREHTELLELANVLVRGLDDRIILWSAGMEQLYGWSRSDVKETDPECLLETQFPVPREHIRNCLLSTGEWSGELIQRRRDGRRLIVASHWVLHRDEAGQPAAILEVNNNVTERRLAEEEVRRLNAELENRVKERTAQLTAANNELEAFTYSVSHDLRAPLRHIDAFARVIEEDLPPQLNEEILGYIKRIRKGTQTMGKLIDDLLNLSRVGRAQPSWQAIDLNILVEDVAGQLKSESADREIEWRLQALPTIVCDRGLMQQVFTNLLSNAVKYTRPRSPALIEVGQEQREGATVIFVRDNGVGFSMKFVDKLFGVFERLHRPEEFEGTGIGLAIVRRILNKHNSQIWAEAEVNQGATFYFTLPNLPQDTAFAEKT